mgnify:CR=1 FL=1
MEKYMAQIPDHLADFIGYLNKDQGSLPAWESAMIASTKAEIQAHIKEHFEKTAMTRQKFVSMPKEIWHEEGTGLFPLNETPRKILGYLPAPELKKLDEIAAAPISAAIAELRSQLNATMDKMRASEADRAEIAPTLAIASSTYADLEAHHAELDKWTNLCNVKEPIINELAQREEFLEEIAEFEAKATGDKDRYKKANSLALADENKFRSYAAKKLKELDARAEKLCLEYKEKTGREFEVDGTPYLPIVKAQMSTRSHNPSLSLAQKAQAPNSQLIRKGAN